MANLTAAMQAEVDRSNPRLRAGVRFTFPDGTKLYSDVGLCSRLNGFHEALVKDWGQIRDASADSRNALEISDWSGLQIIDKDGDWVTRASKYELRGSPVVLTYSSPRIGTSDFFTRFSGVLLDHSASDGVITIKCGPSFMLPLIAPFPEIRVTLADFPELPDELVDIYAPIGPYGRHDSYAFGNATKGNSDGQIAPMYVGEYTETNLEDVEITGSKFLIGVGMIKHVIMVYNNGIPITQGFAPGNWKDQSIYETINGVTWSRLQFTTDKSDVDITLDLEGYETVGDGTGTLITDPTAQLMHFITNFGLGRYKTGPWLPDSAVIDPTYLAALATYLGIQRIPTGYRGARYIEATEERGLLIDAIDAWCASMEVKGLFTPAGQIAFGADSFDDPGDVGQLSWIRRQFHELASGPMTPTYPSIDAVKRIIGETSHSHAQGSYTERLMVLSQTAQSEGADKISRPWGPAVI